MLFATLLLLSPLPLSRDVVLPVSHAAPVVTVAPGDISAELLPGEFLKPGPSAPAIAAEFSELPAPSMPLPKPSPVLAEPSSLQPGASLKPGAAQPGAFAFEPIKPATHRSYDNRNQRRMWYALMVAGHSGAAFDAWSTRRALSGNWGTEADPLMRPFAHSGAIYVATQVGPLLMDFIGRRAMTSEHLWVRKLWWVPQTVGASMSFQAGIHNVGVVH